MTKGSLLLTLLFQDGSIAITKAMEDGLEIDTPQITKTN